METHTNAYGEENYLIDTDSYKVSHYLQYPPGTTSMFSYIESRGGEYNKTVFFGLQYYLKRYLSHRVTVAEVEEAKEFFEAHGEPFNYEGWMYIATELEGKLPVRIRAVPEGTVVPTHNILVSIESTDPKVFWVVSWIETMLLRVWYPINVATRSHKIRQIILEALRVSADDPEAEINFKLHDFGSRGVSSQESARIGGAAHLVNFMGSDTCVGVRMANKVYNIKMAGFSIPAMEHSSVTSWGRMREVEAYRNMLRKTGKKGGIIACVSDSYDLWNACSKLWGEELKSEVIGSGCTVVIRPDSGNPPDVVLRTAQLLEEKFGVTLNSKGFKVLNNVRIIQGDGINENSIQEILNRLLAHKFSATNIAFGMGGALLQQHNRDTLKFAMKCSHIYRLPDGSENEDTTYHVVDGEELVSVDVYKDPVTDHGKVSKAGRLDLIRDTSGNYQTVAIGSFSKPSDLTKEQANHEKVEAIKYGMTLRFDYDSRTVMRTVFENGDILVDDNFDDVRARAKGDDI
jgi:nicotinamide phosphoribosyltransferase